MHFPELRFGPEAQQRPEPTLGELDAHRHCPDVRDDLRVQPKQREDLGHPRARDAMAASEVGLVHATGRQLDPP